MNMDDGMTDPSASAAELRAQAERLTMQARKLRAKALAIESRTSPARSDLVDFDALPGRSPKARADALYTGRRLRDDLFPRGLFGDLAWDILLELFLTRHGEDKLPLRAICRFAPELSNTAERYVSWLEKESLVEVDDASGDPGEARVALSQRGADLMGRFFALTDGHASPQALHSSRMRLVSSNRPGEG